MSYQNFPNILKSASIIMVSGIVFTIAASEPSFSRSRSGLSGSWSGVGTIVLPSGASEEARCRARFRPSGDGSYSMSAVCATPSQRASQTGELDPVGSNRYAGSIYNDEYNYTGEIFLTVRGDRLNASLSGGQVSGRISMSR